MNKHNKKQKQVYIVHMCVFAVTQLLAETYRQTDRQTTDTDRQTDNRQTHTHRETDRQTDRLAGH